MTTTPRFDTVDITGTNGGNAPDSCVFFMPRFWGMRTVNILNSGRRPLASVESPAYSLLGGLTGTNGVKMKLIVKFEEKEIELVNVGGVPMMTATQIGSALNIIEKNGCAKIYNRHAEEFTPEMTRIIQQGRTRVRVFNREGAWLIGMFARTPKAAAFRKWVLTALAAHVDGKTAGGEVSVREHTCALPSGKREIVLSEKAKQEIGGIVKACLGISGKPSGIRENELKGLIREVLREELAGFLLKDGVTATEPFNGNVTADGLPAANWALSIVHGAGALQSIIGQLKDKQTEAAKLLA